MSCGVQLKRYSEKTAAAVFRQILHAVNYLHERKIVHRDIKPDNVVFKTTIRNSSDFGKDNVCYYVFIGLSDLEFWVCSCFSAKERG